jgi:hypothetical protein
MWRALPTATVAGAIVLCAVTVPHATSSSSTAAQHTLERFLAAADPPAEQYRALRHLEADNSRFEKSAWMDVWTEMDREGGFRYEVAASGGSEYIRKKVFLRALEEEKKMWNGGVGREGRLNAENYEFDVTAVQDDGLMSVAIKPRHKGLLLVTGSIFVRPDDAELVRIEGRLTRTPSFWTRDVDVVRWYGRFAGVRMPTAFESTANVLMAGRSTMKMTYEYETVNYQTVGRPELDVRSRPSSGERWRTAESQSPLASSRTAAAGGPVR